MIAAAAIFLGVMFGMGFTGTPALAAGSLAAEWVVHKILMGRR